MTGISQDRLKKKQLRKKQKQRKKKWKRINARIEKGISRLVLLLAGGIAIMEVAEAMRGRQLKDLKGCLRQWRERKKPGCEKGDENGGK